MNNIEYIEALISQGRCFEARSQAEEAVKESSELRLKQLYALALSKSGTPEAALEFMEPVYRQFPDDPESSGILGSIYKELFKKNQSAKFATQSRDTYLRNFSATKSYYTGINAASMSAMAGQAARSREIANEVIALVESSGQEGFWELATLGEAYMLIKNRAKAVQHYVQARKLAVNDWGKVTSVYNQLWLLNHFLPVPSEVLTLFNPPAVVAFVGHMIDQPGRATPRFPLALETRIKEAIVNSIRTQKAGIGYCSLACGGDILFAEAMVEQGGEVNIFIPFALDDFINVSVAFAGEDWVRRFYVLMNNHAATFITHEPFAGHTDLLAFQSKIIFGSAILRSTSLHGEPRLLTVLSEMDLKRKEGGTRDALRLWPYPKGYLNINPDIFLSQVEVSTSVSTSPKAATAEPVLDRPVIYLVLADYTHLNSMERDKILKTIRQKIDEETINCKANQCTDATALLGFHSESSALDFVQFLQEFVRDFRSAPQLTFNLHAGPVFLLEGADLKNPMMKGEPLTVVQEMNKITTPGFIYASELFAALLALNTTKFSLDYAGVFTVNGGRKNQPVYRVNFKSVH